MKYSPISSPMSSEICHICRSDFSVITDPKQICEFCYKFVCKKCSMQKMEHEETKNLSRICDSCFTHKIKQSISMLYIEEQERYKSEIVNLKKRYYHENALCEVEALTVQELEKDINQHNEKTQNALKLLENECKVITKDIDKAEKDYSELFARYESSVISNWEADRRIKYLSEENEETGYEEDDICRRITILEEEITMLLKGYDGNDAEGRKSQAYVEELKVFRVKQELENLNLEKSENINRIQKLKESEKLKDSNIAMLSGKLTLVRMIKSQNDEDFTLSDLQDSEILRLESQVARIERKVGLENSKCKCEII